MSEGARCAICSQVRPGKGWDPHSVCPACRSCTRQDPCEKCMGFSPSQWREIDNWRRALLDATPDPGLSALSTSGPRADGTSSGKSREGGATRKRGGLPGAGTFGSAAAVSPGTTPSAHSEGSSPAGMTNPPAGSGTSVPRASSSAPPSRGTDPKPSSSLPLDPAGSPAPSGDRTQSEFQGATDGRSLGPVVSAAGAGAGSGSTDPGSVGKDTQTSRGRSRSREGSSRRPRRESPGDHGSSKRSRGHRSRSQSGSRHRRRSPESSDSDSDSDAGYRRDRSNRSSRYSPGGAPDFSDPAWVSQLANLLGPLVAGEVAKQTAHLQPSPAPPAPSAPVNAEPPRTDSDPQLPPPPAPPADSLELLASDEFDEEEDWQEGEEVYVGEGSVPDACATEEESPRGTDLPPSLVASVAEVLTSKLGFQAASRPSAGASGSRLSATNEAVQAGPPEFPVDVQCRLRLESLAAKQSWTAFPALQERLVRVAEEDWGTLFKPPSISDETRNKVRVAEGLASGSFREPLRRRMEEDWFQADLAARAGLKFSSVFLLAAEALRRAHLQLPGDEVQFSRAEIGHLVFLLGPLARLVYDQFARVALKAVKVRRANVLDSFQWPSAEARSRLEQLPVVSPDLFSGQFMEKFAEEVKRHEETASAFFKPPARSAAVPPTRAASRGKAKAPTKKQRPKKSARSASWRGGSAWKGQPSGRARGRRSGSVTRGRGRGQSATASRPSYAPPQPAKFPPAQP